MQTLEADATGRDAQQEIIDLASLRYGSETLRKTSSTTTAETAAPAETEASSTANEAPRAEPAATLADSGVLPEPAAETFSSAETGTLPHDSATDAGPAPQAKLDTSAVGAPTQEHAAAAAATAAAAAASAGLPKSLRKETRRTRSTEHQQ